MEIEKVFVKSEVKHEYPNEEFYNLDCNIIEDEPLDIKPEEIVVLNKDKPYKCGICSHRTNTDTLLKIHMRMHLVKRMHQCEMCQKTFSFVTELNNHILTHPQPKISFQCDVCGRNCHTKEDLDEHYKVHSKTNSIHCQLCFKGFPDDSYLRLHQRAIHKKEYFTGPLRNDGIVEGTSEGTSKVSFDNSPEPKKFKNNSIQPLNEDEKLLLLGYIEKLGINEHYQKLDEIRSLIKDSWAKMVTLFAENDYNRSIEKLARTYFHLKNQAKTHIERYYIQKKPPKPRKIDYMCVILSPLEFSLPGLDITQVLKDGNEFVKDNSNQGENDCVLLDDFEETEGLSEKLSEVTKDPPRKRSLDVDDGPPLKASKSNGDCIPTKGQEQSHELYLEPLNKENGVVNMDNISNLKEEVILADNERRDHLYRLELQWKAELFEMEKKHKMELYKKEMEVKELKLKMLIRKNEYFKNQISK